MSPPTPDLTHSFATAPDGAKLSYYTIGTGPPLLILHGAVTHALTHKELAVALSPYFTVHTASRRGRGLSDPYPTSLPEALVPNPGSGSDSLTYNPDFTAAVLAVETSDLQALLHATQARYLIAVSSGALITLQHLLTKTTTSSSQATQLEKVILFEPPLFAKEDYPTSPSITQYEAERAAGDDVSAMVTAMQIVQLGPGWVPRWLMRWVVGIMFRTERGRGAGAAAGDGKAGDDGAVQEEGNVGMKGLGALLRFDFAVAEGMAGCEDRFVQQEAGTGAVGEWGLSQRVMLLGGDTSPAYLKKGLDLLVKLLGARKTVIGGVGHEVLCGPEMRGRPEKAVPAICKFLRE